MKLLVLSDLHLERGSSYTLPRGLEYDAVVLAGDIWTPGSEAIRWAKRETTFGGKPVLFVAGNHEFYGRTLSTERKLMMEAAQDRKVHFLDRDGVVIDGVRFLGCSLWTDFQLPLRQPNESLETNVRMSLDKANRGMNDFVSIKVASPVTSKTRWKEVTRPLRAEDTLAMHWVDRDWLRRELEKPFGGPTVVVTHHAPDAGSVAAEYRGDALGPAFVSQLPEVMFEVPVLWVHGHTHASADYYRGTCRVVSNPRGYWLQEEQRFENRNFQAGLVVEVGDQGTPRSLDKDYARAQASLEEYQRTGVSHSVDEVLARLQAKVEVRRRQLSDKPGPSLNEQKALQDPYVRHGFDHYDELQREGLRIRGERLEAADMVSVAEAAAIAGQSAEDIEAAVARGDCLGIADEAGVLRLPRWQFETVYTDIWKRLAEALGTTDGWVLLAAVETPLGALDGITPRAAIERGQADRVFGVIGYD